MFNGDYYQQTYGAPMGSPVSPIVANIYMEQFEVIAIASAPTPPKYWDRYVDDTHTVVKKNKLKELHDHLNDVKKGIIEFTLEECGEDGGVPFLDTYCTVQEDGSIKTSVYRKPTHTDLYLNWESHHPLSAKLSVVNTLFYRAEVVCSDKETLDAEKAHLNEVLSVNGYPDWAIKRGTDLIRRRPSRQNKQTDGPKKEFKGFIVVSYVQGLSEPFKRILENVGIRVYFKGGCTLKSQLVSPKDKDPKEKKSNCVYMISCGDTNCGEKYIGETGRTLEERYKEHASDTKSALTQHRKDTGHPIPDIQDDQVQIIDSEDNTIKRRIVESLYIKVNDPSLNRNIGKTEIPNIYDKVFKEKGV